MRYQRILSVILLVAFASGVQAQPGDWWAVEKLHNGWNISAVEKYRVYCTFEYATHDELVCEHFSNAPINFGPEELRFSRRSIREVRLEHSDGANEAIGVAIGGGTGATLGAAIKGDGTTREGRAILLGGIGALIGGFAGRDFPILHGKVIYRR